MAMSSTKARLFLVAAAAAALSACASQASLKVMAPLPTEQYQAKVTVEPQRLLLTPHPEGPSPAQQLALYDLLQRWRAGPGGPIVIETPVEGSEQTFQATVQVDEFLRTYGAAETDIQRHRYQDVNGARAPIRVTFPVYAVDAPKCGQVWKDLARADNQPTLNFGCAVTANAAAMIANPTDLLAPRQPTPADASRRQVVLEKYRSGAVTSSAKDTQASGTVSSAL